jgi:signal transduction histidine kinase
MRIEEISVSGLLEECREVKQAAAGKRGLSLEASIDDSEATLHGDRRLLRTAVANLIDTSMRYSRRGGKITIGHRRDTMRESIVVADNGTGVPCEELRGMRDLFGRAGGAGVDETEEMDAGMIGLYIVRDIVDLHGGRVGVRSLEGEGSTFALHIPRRCGAYVD